MRFWRQPGASAIALLCVCLAIHCGCRTSAPVAPPATAPSAPTAGFPRTVVDSTGSTLSIPAPPLRIVSLAPSNTEILFDLGVGDRVVADTESCDFPPEAKQRPHVGGFSAGDLEKIETQFPDLVVAMGDINQKLIGALRAAHIRTLVVQPHTTSEILSSIQLIGKAVGEDTRAEKMAAQLQERLARVRASVAGVKRRPKVLIMYSANPIYTSPPDSFIHDLIGFAGGDDIVQTDLPQNIISPAVVIEKSPDVIVCSASLQDSIRRIPGWNIVPAVKDNRFYSPTGEAELTRPGPRIASAAEQLAGFLHPEIKLTRTGSASP